MLCAVQWIGLINAGVTAIQNDPCPLTRLCILASYRSKVWGRTLHVVLWCGNRYSKGATLGSGLIQFDPKQGICWRTFAELSVSVFAPLYNTLVRSHREYITQACSLHLVADADCLEQIVRLVMRLVKGSRWLPYEERLRRPGLHSLKKRCPRGCRYCRGCSLSPNSAWHNTSTRLV